MPRDQRQSCFNSSSWWYPSVIRRGLTVAFSLVLCSFGFGAEAEEPRESVLEWDRQGDAEGQLITTHGIIASNNRIQKFTFGGGCLVLELTVTGSGDDTLLSWNEPIRAESYCVEMGDIGTLRITEGDFRYSIVQELASHTTENSLSFSGTPAPGEAYWFLVKDNPAGTFDSGCPSQVGSRDQEILSSGDVCVN